MGEFGLEDQSMARVLCLLHWRKLKSSNGPGGYLRVSLCAGKGKAVDVFCHVLVIVAFRGLKPAGQECRHLNGNKHDNRLVNLVWGTHKENMSDARKHGTLVCGERSKNAKLTCKSVNEIRSQKSVLSWKALAQLYGVSIRAVRNAYNRKTWAHV